MIPPTVQCWLRNKTMNNFQAVHLGRIRPTQDEQDWLRPPVWQWRPGQSTFSLRIVFWLLMKSPCGLGKMNFFSSTSRVLMIWAGWPAWLVGMSERIIATAPEGSFIELRRQRRCNHMGSEGIIWFETEQVWVKGVRISNSNCTIE